MFDGEGHCISLTVSEIILQSFQAWLSFHPEILTLIFLQRIASVLLLTELVPIDTLTDSPHWHRIPPNMQKHGFGTMSMTTTSGSSREGFVIGQN